MCNSYRKVGSSLNTAATIEALMLGIVLGTVPWSKLPRFRMKGWMPDAGCEKGGGDHFLDKITWFYRRIYIYYKGMVATTRIEDLDDNLVI